MFVTGERTSSRSSPPLPPSKGEEDPPEPVAGVAVFGAWIGGRFFDLTGSYALTFATAIASGLLAIGCMWAGRSRRPVPEPPGRGFG